MAKKKVALLVLAYGTPEKEQDIEKYYTHIRGGRKPSNEMVEELTERYQSIGGISPLAKITRSQVQALTAALNNSQSTIDFVPYLGLKHIEPFIEDVVKQIHEDGVTEVVSIVLAPHYSTLSVKSYNDRVRETAEELGGITIHAVDSWYTEPKFTEFWVKSIQEEFETLSDTEKANAVVIFSAHSLPERIRNYNDPYESQLKETAAAIFSQLEVPFYAVGWQSEGKTPEPWLGPDVLDLTKQLHQEKGYQTYIYAPVGFVADHLEVLYDNDTECKELVEELEAKYCRPVMPNTDPVFIQSMVDVVLKQVK